MSKAAIIIPATGHRFLSEAIASALYQTYPTRVIVVSDGRGELQIDKQAEQIVLPDITGANGWNGHRIYTHISPLIDADYICMLDEDNWFDAEHVRTLVEVSEKHGIAWSHRKIWDEDGITCFGTDVRESIMSSEYVPYLLVDTGQWCFRRDHVHFISGINHQSYIADRYLTARILTATNERVRSWSTGLPTLQYRGHKDRYAFYKNICGQS